MDKLNFEFTANQSDNTVVVNRAFKGSVLQLWRAWTEAEYLDCWWAPHPFVNKTKNLDLKEGGNWFYSMSGPEGQEFWGKAVFKKIVDQHEIQWEDAFCDETGTPVEGFAKSLWTIRFSQKEDVAYLAITIAHEKWEDVEANINMGFKEGFCTALDNLEKLILTI
ncbi:MAG: SRPBCC domain-containing protein [Flavobacteriaceae bacterium]|jgi:uncharacterized protein YndB with AHSA1/START domain|nr:SRPBCC domain-containing protein [Flavobacteriaceae bacterium]